MRDIAAEPPDFVNELGIKWWHEPEITQYACSKGLFGARAFTLECPNGYRTRLLTEGENVLADDPTLDGLGVKIDLLAFERSL